MACFFNHFSGFHKQNRDADVEQLKKGQEEFKSVDVSHLQAGTATSTAFYTLQPCQICSVSCCYVCCRQYLLNETF